MFFQHAMVPISFDVIILVVVYHNIGVVTATMIVGTTMTSEIAVSMVASLAYVVANLLEYFLLLGLASLSVFDYTNSVDKAYYTSITLIIQ